MCVISCVRVCHLGVRALRCSRWVALFLCCVPIHVKGGEVHIAFADVYLTATEVSAVVRSATRVMSDNNNGVRKKHQSKRCRVELPWICFLLLP